MRNGLFQFRLIRFFAKLETLVEKMQDKSLFLLLVILLCVYRKVASQELLKLVNLDHHCLRCLCHTATECDLTRGCVKGYCGPYKISRLYWKDAGEVILPDDDKERAGAYEDCALNYRCAQQLVLNYFAKYGRDCNEDGVTDCDDYMMINFNGGWQCQPPLNRSDAGREWLSRYRACNPKQH